MLSHEAALATLRLSDVLSSRVHLTLPESWRRRRVRVPDGLELHHGDVSAGERTWVGAVPSTSASRTLIDCVSVRVAPDLIRQAIDDGLHRGLFTTAEIRPALDYLRSFEKE